MGIRTDVYESVIHQWKTILLYVQPYRKVYSTMFNQRSRIDEFPDVFYKRMIHFQNLRLLGPVISVIKI